MKKINKLLLLSVIINVVTIFFGNYFTNLYYLQILSSIFAILYVVIYRKKININFESFVWIVFIIYLFIIMFFSRNIEKSFELTFLVFLAIIIKIIYQNAEDNWQKIFINLMSTFSMVHVIATILQFLFPSFINNINKIILSKGNLIQNNMLYQNGAYAGITGQTSLNAFFITIFILLTFVNILIKEERKKLNLGLLLLSLLSLFITAKRGMLIFSFSIIFLMYMFISFKDRKHNLKYFITIVLLILGTYILIMKIPATRVVFEKFTALSKEENSLNGRDYLWRNTYNVFKENKLTGVGLGYISNIIGDYTHNVYLQLLAEIGLFGSFLYLISVICSLILTIKNIKTMRISFNWKI